MRKVLLLLISVSSFMYGFSQSPGTLDTEFGENGILRIDSLPDNLQITFVDAAIIDSAGIKKWVAWIGGNIWHEFTENEIFMVKITELSGLKSGYPDYEIWSGTFPGKMSQINVGVIDPDGNLILAGNNNAGGQPGVVIGKFEKPGKPKEDFKDNGFGNYDFRSYYTFNTPTVDISTRGLKLFIYGSMFSQQATKDNNGFFRLEINGNIDSDFGNSGFKIISEPPGVYIDKFSIGKNELRGAGSKNNDAFFIIMDLDTEDYKHFSYSGGQDATYIGMASEFDGLDYYFLIEKYMNEVSESYFIKTDKDFNIDDSFTENMNKTITENNNTDDGGLFRVRAYAKSEYDLSHEDAASQAHYDFRIKAFGRYSFNSTDNPPVLKNGSWVGSFDKNGNPDPDFGTEGITRIQLPESTNPVGGVVSQEGKILFVLEGENNDIYFTRLHGYPPSTSGINIQKTSSPEIKIFPNPFAESVSISINQENETAVSCGLYNIDGKLLISDPELKLKSGVQSFIFNTSHLAVGAYIVKCQLNNKIHSYQVLKGKN